MDRTAGRPKMRSTAIVAVACFVLGVLASQLLATSHGPEQAGQPPATSPSPAKGDPPGLASHSAAPALDVKPPKIFFDPDSISLLPDASLRLELPETPSATPPRTEPPRSPPARSP